MHRNFTPFLKSALRLVIFFAAVFASLSSFAKPSDLAASRKSRAIPLGNTLDNAGLSSINATGAYSLRKLSSAYTGFAIKVRRVSDNAEANIAFDGTGKLSGTSVATVTLAGTSSLTVNSTLAFSTFFTATDVRVMTWYDQTGNGNDITQATTSFMPKVVSNGVLSLLNNKAALNFSGVSMTVPISSSLINAQGSIATVHSQSALQGGYAAILSWPTGVSVGYGPLGSAGQFGLYNTNNFNNVVTPASVATNTMYASNATWTNSNVNVTESRNKSVTTGNLSYRFTGVGTGVLGNNGPGFDGSIPEVLIFSTPLTTTDRQSLENNQFSYYASTDATLSALNTTAGTLSPVFASATTAYTASVSNATTSITVTPTVNDATAIVKVNGNAVTSGSASGAIALNTGSNTITVAVTAQDGTTSKSYTITVIRAMVAPGNALSFNGSNNYITGTSTVLPLGNAARTIEAWIKPGAVQNGTIFNWGTGGVNNRSGILYINGYLYFVGQSNDLQGATALPVGKWSHVAATFDGSTLKLYVNGVLDNSATKTLNTSGSTFRLGVSSESFNEYFNGSIDEVRVWNTALTQTQLQANMLNTVSASSSGLVAYYNFDNGTASGTNTGLNTLSDRTSNSNNGALTNFGLTGSSGNWVESYAMVLPTSTAASSIATTSFTANWTAPATGTTDNYLLDVSTNSAFSSLVSGYSSLSVTGTSKTVTGLASLTPYYYRVRANKASITGEGGYSATTSATTLASTDATLSTLTSTAGTLSPTFASATTAYTASVPNATTSITVTPTLNDATATVKINGATVASGSASGAIALNVGANTITVVVTAQDGTTTKSYTIAVNRISNDATLSALTSSAGTLSPTFASVTTAYTASVSNAITGITITPALNYAAASVKVNGTAVTSGSASGTIDLNVGSNAITVLVTAEDGTTTKSYTFTVTRAPNPLNNAGLTATTATGAYSLRKLSSTYTGSAVKVRRISDNAEATIAFDGTGTISGTSIATVTLAGTSSLTVNSTLAFSTFFAGTDVRVMTWFDQTGNGNDITQATTSLMPKVVSNGVLSLLNNKTALNFSGVSMTVPISSSLLNAQGSVATVHSQSALQGGYSAILSWASGVSVGYGPLGSAGQFGLYNTNNFNNVVTSGSVAINTMYASNATWTNSNVNVTESRNKSVATGGLSYRFTGIGTGVLGNNGSAFSGSIPEVLIFSTPLTTTDRQALENNQFSYYASADATLSALSTTAGTLSPVFASATTAYTASVPNATTSITVTPTVNDVTATVKVNGTTVTSGAASGAIALNVGNNTITVAVTAQDGTTTKSYTLTVTRVSTDATLSVLSTSAGTLSPAFASATTAYTASVPNATASIKITPTVTEANATIKVNGTALTSGSESGAIALNVGSNTITVAVTAQDGTTTKSYTLTVTRISNDATLSALSTPAGTLSPAFAAATTAYTVNVPNATSSIKVTPTVTDANATIKINGTAVTSGSASGTTALNVGSNTFIVAVTAQDGTTIKSYTLTVTRECPSITVTQPVNQIVGGSAATTAISFLGTGANTYSWTNNNTAIGLAASGTGNISSFTATNATASPITGTVTVTPSSVISAYIAQSNNVLSVINTSNNAVITTIPISGSATGTSVSPDGSKVYVSHYSSSNNLSVISTATNTVIATVTCGTNANGVAVSPDGSKVYVVNSGSNSVSVVNAATNTVAATVAIGAIAGGICISPDGSYVYVVNSGSNNVSVINTATNTVATTITVGSNPLGIAISSDGSTVYVSNHGSANLSVINTATNTVVATIAAGTQPYGITVNADGSRVYVSNYGSANMSVINTSTNAAIATVSTGNNPSALSISPDGANVFVTLGSSGNVKVISTSTNTVTNTIAISGGSGALGKFIAGSGCTGTPVSFSITVNPRPGNALSFNGSNNYITGTSTVLPLGNAARTIEAWIKPGAVQNGTIFNWGTGGVNSRSGILYISGYLYFVGQNNDLQGATALPVGKWSHVAATFDGSTLKLYVNGVLDNSATKTLNTTGSTFRLGVSSDSFNEYFNGSIDEVRVWNTALTQTQLQANMLNTVSASSSGLVAYYNFENGTASGTNTGLNTLSDQTSNANNGALTNFGLTGSSGNWVESYAMVLPTSTAASSISTTSFTANWTAPATGTTDNYLLDVSTNSAFSSLVSGYSSLSVTGTSKTVTGLASLTPYYYRVRANKASITGEGGYSATTSATTLASTDATLSTLTSTAGTLSPTFASATTAYTASVPNATTSITVTPTLNDATATVKINGTTVTSGSASGAIALNVGANTITVVVTAQDGTTAKSYTLTVTRISNDATLSALSSTAGTLSPVFASATTAYTANVPNATANITVTPTINDATATVKVNGTTVTSGSASGSIDLAVGNNTITVLATAQDGTTTKSYTITVTRAPNPLNNAGLTATTATGAYSLRKLSSTYTGSAIKVRRISDNAEANIAFDGTGTISGTSVATVTLAGTSLTVNSTLAFSSFFAGTDVRVMTWYDQSGNGNDITQSTTSFMPKVVSNGVLSLLNNKAALNFSGVSMTVPISSSLINAQGSIATVHSQSALQGGYAAILSWPSGVSVGYGPLGSAGQFGLYNTNNFNNVVTPASVATNTMYASNATWTNSNVNVTESRNKSVATGNLSYRFTGVGTGVLGNNGPGFSGSIPEVLIFSTPLTTTDRQALENNQFSYYASADATLSALSTTSGTLSPVFASATTAYTASVPNATTSITVTPTVNDVTATVKVNGTTVTSGTASGAIDLAVGNNTITVLATAQDGTTTKSYTITVTRAPNPLNNAGLTATTATGAYSLRKLSSTYTGSAIKVRRISDNAEATIAFDGTGTISGTSVATVTLAGTSSLTVNSTFAFSTFFAATDVRVMTWYDQSGNGNDITQATTSFMPKVVSNGVLSLLNNKAALNFSGVSMTVPISSSLINAQGSIATVHSQSALQGGYSAILSWPSGVSVGYGPLGSAGQFGLYNTNNFNNVVTPGSVATNTMYASNATWTNSNVNVTESRNKSVATGNLSYRFTGVGTGVLGNNGPGFSGSIPEVLIFSTPLTTTDRQALENNQFSYYASTDAKLSALSTTAGTLSPVFASASTAYTASVPNATTSITVTPTVNDVTATVRVNGTTVTGGAASGAIALNVGNNTITVLVTAQNGTTTQSYTLTVTRASAATAPVPMSPTFVASNTNYAASVSDITENVRVTPTVAQANSTVQVRSNGGVYTTITSGTSSPFLDMNLESNVIDVKVTAIDGTTIKIYSITVTKVKSNQFGPISYSGSKGFQNLMDGSHNEWTMSSAASQGNRVSVIAVQPVVDADLSGLSLESVEPTVLPVDLISFDAKVSNSGTVDLSWSTSSEEKNSHFEVLRSLNGVDFTPLATVNGKQNTTDGERKYRVTDSNPFQGNNYYQLIQYDTDGKSKSLGVRMVEVNLETLNAVSVYPNPTTSTATIHFNSGRFTKVSLIDLSGRIIKSHQLNKVETSTEFNLAELPQGAYLITLYGQNIVSKTVIKN